MKEFLQLSQNSVRKRKTNHITILESVTDCYYKVRQVLQSVTDFITKRVRCYKSATVITK